ncbi:MAG: type IV toxin-antitoxin system AbiEi family antitoxin domain-containing protein [Bacteroidia bacterium]|nr:type IV toxin-antitoxin system AbiEi family antitoxin domain-containing protein [Bacteroidia bacterium]
MATKINFLLQQVPKNALLLSSWMAKQKMSTKEQSLCVSSGWLNRLSQGVYYRVGDVPTLYSALYSYNIQLVKKCFVGASTALDLKGFSHFVAMGKPTAFLFTQTSQRLPSWILNHPWDMEVRYFTTKIFGNNFIGIEEMEVDGVDLYVSSPERAFMECLFLAPTNYSLLDTYYVMEMLTTLRPKLVQQLLEVCSSVKVKRLFLFMAEKSKHQWFNSIDFSKVDLGEGKRSIVKNGVFNNTYGITIPKELNEYE